MRFRRRDVIREMFDDLAAKDRQRLQAALDQATPTPGLGELRYVEPLNDGTGRKIGYTDTAMVLLPPEQPKRKRGRRA